jgi:eukaryotic-like serine/threonine-protein kinase
VIYGRRWQSLSDHLDQVLELQEPERSQWLAALATSDPEMAGLVSEALDAREREGFAGFLEGSPPLPLEGMDETTLAGREVGPYVIDAEIGRGGMGSVWRAHRSDGLYQGTVAIKFVHAAWIGRAGEQRFKVEGNLLARLDHPNIARLINAGVLAGSQPYLIIEYIEGAAIDTYCHRENLGLEARINLFLDVLAAVAHAHSNLIVHRDIKPSNVFVTRNGAVKLLDFGIAKLLHEDPGSAALTLSNATPLTPQFAAPEQLLGKPVTTLTDVYSLGLLLYVLLTGAHPLAKDGDSNVELIRAALAEEPARASLAATIPAIRRRALEGDLDNILRKALKKEPAERYASVGFFADDLKRFLTHEPVQARPDTIPYRVSKFVRRHRGGVISALLVAIGLIGTGAVAVWQMYQADAERDISLGETRRATGLGQLNAFMLTESTTQVPQELIRQRLDHAVDYVDRNFQGERDVMASLFLQVGAMYTEIGEAALSAKTTARAEAIISQLDDPYLRTEVGCRRARDFALAHNLPEARARLAPSLESMRHLHVVAPGLSVTCGSAGALIAQADGDYANAVANLQSVLRSLKDGQSYGSKSWVAAANDLARTLNVAGDFRGAWEVDSANLKLARETARTDSSSYFAMASVGCNSLRNGGQPRRSRDFVDSILADVRSQAPDADLPFYLVGCRAVAEMAMEQPDPSDTGLAQAIRAAESAGMVSMANLFQTAALRQSLGRGDIAAADAAWSALAPAEEKMLGAQERGAEVVRLLLLHADLDMAHGRSADAGKRIEQAAALIAARRQPTNSDSREVEVLFARLALAAHRFEPARQHAQAALEIARSAALDPQSSAWIGEALLWRSRAETALGQTAAAKATAAEAVPHLEKNMDAASPMLAAARAIASS